MQLFGKEIQEAVVEDPKPTGIKLYKLEKWSHEIEIRIDFRTFISCISEFLS